MATNPPKGDGHRNGAVKGRSQVYNPKTGNWTKRDAGTGRFMDRKADQKPFKGVRKESAASERGENPFAVFTEWAGDADDDAYKTL